ncbi:hypothetical protein I4U23_016907 [Adineta vaga]|nr:hypothetical protein I4U23_016907 [Adineta vaga]
MELWKLKPPLTELYEGAWIFANKKHEQYSLVKQIFTTTSLSINTIDIGRALGYPLPNGENTIQNIDDTESKERNTCCVPMIEYNVGEGSFLRGGTLETSFTNKTIFILKHTLVI